MGKIKCPECNGCMDFIYVSNIRYIYCGFCHTFRQGRNDSLVIVPSPFSTPSNKIDDPIMEEENGKE